MRDQLLLKNINVFNVKDGKFRNNLDILIENDIIKEVGKISDIYEENLPQIDCTGKFAIPGLFECHAHLALLTTTDDETKKQILKEFGVKGITKEDEIKKQILKDFVVKGITQVRDVGGPVKTLKNLMESISNGEFVGPDIFFAGPMLEKSPLYWENFNKILPGFTVAINSKEDVKNIIKELSNCDASLVKTFNKFDVDVFEYLVGEAKEQGLPVTHDPGTPLFQSIPMDIAIDFGIRCFEHGKAPWPVVLKDDIKSEHDKLLTTKADKKEIEAFQKKVCKLGIKSISLAKLQELIDKMLQNHVYICPTLHALKGAAEHPPGKKPKEMSKDQLEDFKRRIEILSKIFYFFTKEMIKRNVKILVGQDGVIPEFTFNEMQLLRECELSESEIIKGATIYPAEWLGVSEQVGSISPNKKANILILNKNPLENIQNIRTAHIVLKNGTIVFQ